MSDLTRRSFLKGSFFVGIAASLGIGCNDTFHVTFSPTANTLFQGRDLDALLTATSSHNVKEPRNWFPLRAEPGDTFWHLKRQCMYTFHNGKWWKISAGEAMVLDRITQWGKHV
jgi:hypothetical protein